MELQEKIIDLEKELATLPSGSISVKNINGKQYYYHRVQINGKRKEIYIDFDKVDDLKKKMEYRKELEEKLKELRTMLPKEKSSENKISKKYVYRTYIKTGEALKRFAEPVKNYRKRDCYNKLHDYIYESVQDKVLILYGLRRTGKTTLIRQILCNMTEDDICRAAFVQVKCQDSLADINEDMKILEASGYKYVFIDEITLASDFIEGAALFSDLYAACGMKIILSGTDSLGFAIASSDQLFDRSIMIHTTFIPYREFEMVLGRKGIDEYIRFGGTMSLGGTCYNNLSIFTDTDTVNEYIDSAIAKNIQHSLKNYQDGGHFRHLEEMYESNELTSAINRVVEDMNHRFTVEVLTKDFVSNDLSISAGNLRRDKINGNDIIDHIDVETFTEHLKKALNILNKAEQNVEINKIHAAEIKEYLMILDLVYEIDKKSSAESGKYNDKITVISQPGMRYAQAKALVESLMQDDNFNELSLIEKNAVMGRIISEIKGRMMEEIVLLETKLARADKQVFKLQFAIGEFDMVVSDTYAAKCQIYEIKYNDEAMDYQTRHLHDENKCAITQHRYGEIVGKYVIYRGKTQTVGDIQYVNVEEYLNSLG